MPNASRECPECGAVVEYDEDGIWACDACNIGGFSRSAWSKIADGLGGGEQTDFEDDGEDDVL